MFRRKKGQSTLEYVIVLTAIVAAIIFAVTAFGARDSSSGMGRLMDESSQKIQQASGEVATIIK